MWNELFALGGGDGKKRILKQRVITASEQFVPSPGLIAAGGAVMVEMIGGGGGGGGAAFLYATSEPNFGVNGGAAGGVGYIVRSLVVVTAPVSVVIGAGGLGGAAGTNWYRDGMPGGAGGNTSFGSLVALGGRGAGPTAMQHNPNLPLVSRGGHGSVRGQDGDFNTTRRAMATSGFAAPFNDSVGGVLHDQTGAVVIAAQVGGGGAGAPGSPVSQATATPGGAGGAGVCIVTWWEEVE